MRHEVCSEPGRPAPRRTLWAGQGVLLVLGLLAGLGSPAAAQPTVVKNDNVVDFGQAIIQAGFAGGEIAASWLTSPCHGEITHVSVIWLSLTGGAPAALGEWIRVFAPGTFPNPGAVLADLPGPLMNDGFENQFPIVPPIAVSMNDVFVVGYKFLESPPIVGPSVVNDADGCQAGKNGIFVLPVNIWFSSCTLGVSGDFAIRAVVNCGVDPTIFIDGFETGNALEWTDEVISP